MTMSQSALSWRDRAAKVLRENRLAIGGELLLVSAMLVVSNLFSSNISSALLFYLVLLIGSSSLWIRRSGWRQLGLTRPANWWHTLLLGIGIAVIFQVIDSQTIVPVLIHFIGKDQNLSSFHPLYGNHDLWIGNLIFLWPLIALPEEMIFRGYLLNRWADLCGQSAWKWVFGLFLSTIFFTYLHSYQGMTGVINIVLPALLLGGLYLATRRNLWLSVVTHGFVDTIFFTMIYLGYWR